MFLPRLCLHRKFQKTLLILNYQKIRSYLMCQSIPKNLYFQNYRNYRMFLMFRYFLMNR
jgi:hypothetical protein